MMIVAPTAMYPGFRLLQGIVLPLQSIAFRAAIIVVLAFIASYAARTLARRIESSADTSDGDVDTLREERGRRIASLIHATANVVIAVVAIVMLLGLFVDVRPLLAGTGIIGLAVAFGAQALVRDFVTGFFLLLENQLALGDHVRIGAWEGIVERMTLRVVYLRDPDGALHVIPNGEIKQLTNYTRTWARAVVDVEISAQSDVDRAIKALERVGAELFADDRWRPALLEKPYVTGIERLSQATVTLRIVAKTGPRQRDGVAREMRRRAKNALDNAQARAGGETAR